MKRLTLLVVVALTSCPRGDEHGAGSSAPPQSGQPGQPGPDPLAAYVIPPEAVMEHQSEIGVTPDQQRELVAAIKSTQAEMVDLQWKMVKARDALGAALAADRVEEAPVLERADALFALEREVKRRQLSLVVRVRSVLTAEQRARLHEIRDREKRDRAR